MAVDTGTNDDVAALVGMPPDQRGPTVIATHQSLADELGTVREVVSRLLRGREERGWMRLERERVSVVDL